MLDLEKIIYIKDLRNGRYITIFFAFMLFILNNYFKTYIFFSMLILFPKSFLNLIWSYNDEFVFFFFYSKEKISNVILANKTITISELNIVFFISALFFLDSFQLIRIIELNIFVLFYFTLSDFLFYVNFFKKHKTLNLIINISISIIAGQILLLGLIEFTNHSEVKLILFLLLIISQILINKYLTPKINLNKYIN